MIEHLNDIRRKKNNIPIENKKDTSNGANKNNKVDDEPDLLSDEEKELLGFMREQPKTIKETRSMKNVGRHILPTRSKEKIINGQATKIVDKLEEVPKLGF